MIRQARTSDTVLVKSREMTSRSQTLALLLGREGVKTTENKPKYIQYLLQYNTVLAANFSKSDSSYKQKLWTNQPGGYKEMSSILADQ
jgi:hypothetical protein